MIDLKKLLATATVGEMGPRNGAAVAAAAFWGLTAAEASLVTPAEVLTPKGKLRKTWTIPAEFAHNGRSRRLYNTHPKLVELLEVYIEWRVSRGWGVTNLGTFRSLDAEAPLLLNDRGKSFGFTRREAGGKAKLQPSGFNALFRSLLSDSGLSDAGITYRQFRRQLMIELHRQGLSLRNIMDVLGVRSVESVRRVVMSDPVRVEEAVAGIHRRI